ncbi:MAG: alkaline phosphatase family protein, partial [Clostridia bacterium]|nr:alkaline phosphatase family protein [Clostridia bacterium]
VEDGDSVIFFNFRGDRSIEISKAFEDESFDKFDRVRFPKTIYAGMLEYDGDLHIPSRYLVSPPEITDTLGEKLAAEKITQLALSETQKYGHVTYFWNGNKSGKYDEETETYIEIPSDVVPFEQRPWMKCAEITDTLIEAMESGKYGFIRVNFPNGDMVGHTGSMEATIVSMEALDLCIGRILDTADKLGVAVLFTADHGNADECLEMNKKTGEVTNKPKTSHTLNPVPFIFYDNSFKDNYTVVDGEYGLSNIASTVVNLLGYKAPEKWDASMIEVK